VNFRVSSRSDGRFPNHGGVEQCRPVRSRIGMATGRSQPNGNHGAAAQSVPGLPARPHPTSAKSSPEKVCGYVFMEPLGGWY
jgi:hypothetical protein